MDQLDQLIDEIVSVLGITREEVFDKFTKEDLKNMLSQSKCEPSDAPGPIFTGSVDDDDIPCEDLGSPLNPDDSTDLDDLINKISDKDVDPELDISKCIDSVKDVNKEIELKLDLVTKYRILLDKLVELKDNLIGIQYYFDERIDRAGTVLNDFKPVLKSIKNIKADIQSSAVNAAGIRSRLNVIAGYENPDNYASEVSQLKSRLSSIQSDSSDLFNKLADKELILKNKSKKYPTLQKEGILGSTSSLSALNDAVFGVIDSGDISQINRELKKYSEFLKVKKYSKSRSSFSEILSSSLIQFEVEFQNLLNIEITKESVDRDTGKKKKTTELILIKNNPLLKDNSFFKAVPGYKIKNVKTKEEPKGALYEDFYNKLKEPIDNFFTLEERGLTSEANLLDPNLKGTDHVTKKENGTEYYIRDLETLENFYESFDSKFKEKKEEVKTGIINRETKKLKATMIKLARLDVDSLLAIGQVNLYLPEDDSNLSTIKNSIKSANLGFAGVIGNLNSEIERIKTEIESIIPSSDRVKARLKEINPECFKNVDKEEDGPGDDDSCKDVNNLLGSDPFFQTITEGSNGALPNCTNLCYWKKFSKIVNKMGLFPIPNNPKTLRYWPVGLVLYVPVEIKIPLPIIWIPILSISTMMGTHVLFITINGLFISPIMFFFSSSGLKKHSVTLRGPSDKFGFDRFDESIKKTIKIPLNVAALNSPDLKITANILDKTESVADAIDAAKKSIFKRIDDLGNPVLKGVNSIKTKIENKKNELKKEYIKSIEDGNSRKADELRKKLSVDQIDIKSKVDALSEDIINYFDRIELPTLVIPKEKGKINPNLSGVAATVSGAIESATNKLNGMIPESKAFVIDHISLAVAKYKDVIEEKMPQSSINLEKEIDLVKDTLSDMAKEVFKRARGIGPDSISTSSAISQLNKAKNSGNIEKINSKMKDISEKLDASLIKKTLSITPDIILKLSLISVSFDPFASCCSKKKPFTLPQLENPLIKQAFDLALSPLNTKISQMSIEDLKSLFGGKVQINARDLRLGLLSISRIAIPNSISFPIPDINISSLSSMFSGLSGSMKIPQAPFPAPLLPSTIPAQIKIDLNIVKGQLSKLLESYVSDNLIASFPQDLDTYFYTVNSNDIKKYLKDFINSKIGLIEDKIKPLYRTIDLAKSAKGIDLSVVEKAILTVPPYGTALTAIFVGKTLAKMLSKNSNEYFHIDLKLLAIAAKILKTALTPITSTPIVYPAIAAAAVAGQIEGIRKIHPILNEDDIPSWERLTGKNILLLAFIDEFITNAADNVGFYRSFLP